MENSKHIDNAAFTRFFNEDLSQKVSILSSLITVFENQHKDFSQVEVNAANYETIERLAHKTKSGAHSFGAISLFNELVNLEELLKQDSHETESIEKQHNLVVDLFSNSLSELKAIFEDLENNG